VAGVELSIDCRELAAEFIDENIQLIEFVMV